MYSAPESVIAAEWWYPQASFCISSAWFFSWNIGLGCERPSSEPVPQRPSFPLPHKYADIPAPERGLGLIGDVGDPYLGRDADVGAALRDGGDKLGCSIGTGYSLSATSSSSTNPRYSSNCYKASTYLRSRSACAVSYASASELGSTPWRSRSWNRLSKYAEDASCLSLSLLTIISAKSDEVYPERRYSSRIGPKSSSMPSK